MKLLKTVDEKIADLGFVKMWENEWGARYERQNARNYIQAVDICHKKSGKQALFHRICCPIHRASRFHQGQKNTFRHLLF